MHNLSFQDVVAFVNQSPASVQDIHFWPRLLTDEEVLSVSRSMMCDEPFVCDCDFCVKASNMARRIE